MRTKAIPPAPGDLETVERIRAAVPLVPGSTEDCCTRIVTRAGDVVPGRDDANTWLAFLTALELAAEHDQGHARTREPLDRSTLADRFPNRVFGAREVLGILETADHPLSTDAVYEAFEQHVPPWERDRDPGGWEDRWRSRVQSLLAWLDLLDLADRTDQGYRPATAHRR